MANITKHKRSRSIVSFLLACSMLTSTFIVDGQSVFALGEAREAVIVNDLEGHGHLEFITAGIEENTNKQEASEESNSDSGLLTADPAKVTPVQIDENGNVILMDDTGEQSSGNDGSQSIDLGNGFSIELDQDGNVIEPEAVDSTVVSSETVESEIVDAESDVNGEEDSEETAVSEENRSADDLVSEDVSGDTTTDSESENEALTDNVPDVNVVQENTVPAEDKRTFMSGDSIVVKAVPDDGYYLNTIKIVTSNNKSISYNITDENYITFRMPTKDIRISATFSDKKTRITTDNSVVDTQTYILSNIDHKYIDSVDKWEEANIIKVSQTIASRAEFYAAGRSVTLNDMFPDDGIRESLSSAFIHAQETAAVLYDVNADSDYYIAYVDTLHDDADVEISDYVFSRINVNGEILTGCYLDVDTGIAYIPKSILTDETSEGVQVQLLNTYEKMFEDGNAPELSTNIIIRRDSKIVERGIISADIYDSDVSAKLPVDYADIKDGRVSISVDINGVTMTDDFYMIDEDSVLTLPVGIINIESIVVDINEVSGAIGSTFDSVTGQVVAKGTTWTDSDKITDSSVTTPGAWRVYAGCYKYLKKGASITSTSGMSNYEALNYADAGTLAKGYYRYTKSADGSFFTSIYNFAYNSSAITKLAKRGSYTGDNGIATSNVWFPYSVSIGSGKLSLSGGLNVGLASSQTFRLTCVHHSKEVAYAADGTQVGDGVTNPLGEKGTKKWKLVILNVDTNKSRLAIGIVTSAYQGGQAGGGVFTVPYEIPVRVTKGVNADADRYQKYSYNGSYNTTTDGVTRGIHTYYPYYADGLVLWISKSTAPTSAIAKVVMNNNHTAGSSGNILFGIKSVSDANTSDNVVTSGDYIYLPEGTGITITEVDYPNNRSDSTGGATINDRTLPVDCGLRLPYGNDNTTYSIGSKTISDPTDAQLKDKNLKVTYRTTRTVKGHDGMLSITFL